jgi:hypothetical protein
MCFHLFSPTEDGTLNRLKFLIFLNFLIDKWARKQLKKIYIEAILGGFLMVMMKEFK